MAHSGSGAASRGDWPRVASRCCWSIGTSEPWRRPRRPLARRASRSRLSPPICADAKALEEVCEWASGDGRELGLLVNNAGIGHVGRFLALGADGRPGVRRVQTGSTGEFAFERISNDPKTVYLLGVRYGGIPFSLRTSFEAGELELTSVIEVYDARAESDGLELGAIDMRIDRGCSGVRITEDHALDNPSDFIFFVPANERDQRAPIARLPLPEGAIYFESLGTTLEEGIELRDGEVLFWGPLHPGDQRLRFGYSLPAEDTRIDVVRSFPAGARNVRVLTFADAPGASGDALRPTDPVEVDTMSYDAVASGPVAPGGEIAFSLELANFEDERTGGVRAALRDDVARARRCGARRPRTVRTSS